MGRPDLTQIRKAEILDAFEVCVARFGLDGSSAERIAEQAGMKRSILRHYIGNRDDLVIALAERVVGKYQQELDKLIEGLCPEHRVGGLIEFFFPAKSSGSTADVLVLEALIAASETYPEVRELVYGYIDGLVQAVAKQLSLAFPKAKKTECWSVAYGVISICFNQESLTPMGLPPKYLKAARSTAQVLVDSLDRE